MIKFIKSLFFQSNVKFLPDDYEYNLKTNKQLLDMLENENFSLDSGNKIVLELLKRALKDG